MRDTKGNDMLKKLAWIDLFVALIAVFLLSACWNSKRETVNPLFASQTAGNTEVPTSRVTETVTETITPLTPTVWLTITPVITATPVMSESKDVGEIIRKLFPYFASPKCTLDILKAYSIRHPTPVLQFSVLDIDPFYEYTVKEIAYNQSHSILAFVAYKDPMHIEQQLILKNISAGTVSEINWSTRTYLRRPIGNIIWIGDNWLVFMEGVGITRTRVFVINIEKMKVILNWETDSRCEP
jgi:hypothetical protein